MAHSSAAFVFTGGCTGFCRIMRRRVVSGVKNDMFGRCFLEVPVDARFHSGCIAPNKKRSLLVQFSSSSSSSPVEEVDPGVVEGTNLRILKYPHPSLRAPNAEVTTEELKDGSIAQIAKEMLLVMYAAEGMGLAAPQVGINKRLMVFNVSGDPKKWLQETILINPKIVDLSQAKDIKLEGCLSFPRMNGPVERSKSITVEAYNVRGKKIKLKYKGWDARVFQHEYDHLDGKVYIDRLTPEDRDLVQPRLNELIKEFEGDGGVP